MQPKYYTVFKVWKTKWYKRPFLWLCGKPTSTVDVYDNVTIDNIEIIIDKDQISCRTEFTIDRETT